MLPVKLMEPLWDGADLAKFLKTSELSERKKRMRGDGIPYVKIGHLVRYIPSVVRAYVAERLQNSTSEIIGDDAKRPPRHALPVRTGSRPLGRPRKAETTGSPSIPAE